MHYSAPEPLTIRPIRENEHAAVRAAARRIFSGLDWLLFTTSEHTLVAVDEQERIVGAAVTRLIRLSRRRTLGHIASIFTVPEVRGLGLGRDLLNAAISYLSERNVAEINAFLEGDSTSSMRVFRQRNFLILPPFEQLGRYGLTGMLRFWWRTWFFLYVGHFLWVRPRPRRPISPTAHFGAAVVTAWLVLAAYLVRWGASGQWAPFAAAAGWAFAFLFVRAGAMTLMAWKHDMPVKYRNWESGFLLSLMLAAVGVFAPLPGNIYTRAKFWRDYVDRPRIGSIALAGSLASSLGLLLVWGLERSGVLPDYLYAGSLAMAFYGLAVIDTLLIFPGMNGRRIWLWNRGYWGAAAALVAALFPVLLFL